MLGRILKALAQPAQFQPEAVAHGAIALAVNKGEKTYTAEGVIMARLAFQDIVIEVQVSGVKVGEKTGFAEILRVTEGGQLVMAAKRGHAEEFGMRCEVEHFNPGKKWVLAVANRVPSIGAAERANTIQLPSSNNGKGLRAQ